MKIIIKSGLFDESFLKGKIKLTLKECVTPSDYSKDFFFKYVDSDDNIYFYVTHYGLLTESEETPGFVKFTIKGEEGWYSEDCLMRKNKLPVEVYVNPDFDRTLTLSKTVLNEREFILDYIASKETMKVPNLVIPQVSTDLVLNGQVMVDAETAFEYYKKVAKNRGNEYVGAEIKMDYMKGIKGAYFISEESECVFSFGMNEIFVLKNEDVEYANLYLKKGINNTFSSRVIKGWILDN